ncbi:MAG TPA: MarR family transcriptional regulator [Acidimicrobiia bacterium]|jgi:DNA-binding MarR family transcriptional regulator
MPDTVVDVDEAAVELALALKRLRARLRAEARPSEGWTISQLSALRRLVAEGPVTASHLARSEHVRPQSMAAIVTTLRDGGLVTAAADSTDGRKTLLRATTAGRRLAKARSESREAWLVAAIDDLTERGRADALVDAITLLNALADWGIDDRSASRARR